MSLRAYARHRGVSLRAVQKAIASGRIAAPAEGRLDAATADANCGLGILKANSWTTRTRTFVFSIRRRMVVWSMSMAPP